MMNATQEPTATGEEPTTIAVGGQRLRVAVRRGAPGRTPLLLASGIGTSLEAFAPLVAALDPDRPVVRFDVPGVGGSPTPAAPYSIPSLAVVVTGLLDVLDHRWAGGPSPRHPRRVDVLGTSWGGALAQQLALAHGCRVRRLVLANTGTGALMIPGGPSVVARLAAPAWRAALDGDPVQDLLADAGVLFGGRLRDDRALAATLARTPLVPASRQGYAYQLAAGATWTSLPFLPWITQPTLLLAGDDDPVVPLANARLMAALLPDATVHVYRGGHLGLVTQARELGAVVERFLGAS